MLLFKIALSELKRFSQDFRNIFDQIFLEIKCGRVLLSTLFNFIFSFAFVVSLQKILPHIIGNIELNSEVRGGDSVDIIFLLVKFDSLFEIIENQDEDKGDKHDDSGLFANLIKLLFLVHIRLLAGVLDEELRGRLVALSVTF